LIQSFSTIQIVDSGLAARPTTISHTAMVKHINRLQHLHVTRGTMSQASQV